MNIAPVEKSLENQIQKCIDQKTKPIGALGMLEEIALQIAMIQKTNTPVLTNPTLLVFAGDHGIAKLGEVNPYPQEVTAQMVFNFLSGGAAINGFCKQHNIQLQIIDAGVNYTFPKSETLINAKIAMGTHNYMQEPAMSTDHCNLAVQKGGDLVRKHFNKGCNIIAFGEMGIGNTSSAALLMSFFTKIPIETCVGAGTGLDADGIKKKKDILKKIYEKYQPSTPLEALSIFGGYEIAMITGGILEAASLGMTILIDGFIVSAALLAAVAINPNCLDYCIFAHNSGEQGHQMILQFLNKKPLLNLQLRLGEGTGAAIAYPLVESALTFLNNMASFQDAGVSNSDQN